MERTFVIERNVESMNVLLSYNYCLIDCTTRWLRMIYLLRGNITPLHQSRSSGFNIQSTTWMTPLDAGISARYKGETFTSTNRPIANNWYKFNLNQQTTKQTNNKTYVNIHRLERQLEGIHHRALMVKIVHQPNLGYNEFHVQHDILKILLSKKKDIIMMGYSVLYELSEAYRSIVIGHLPRKAVMFRRINSRSLSGTFCKASLLGTNTVNGPSIIWKIKQK